MDPQEVLAMADERFERRLTQESSAIRAEIIALRQEMATKQELASLRQEMATRQELEALRQDVAAIRAEVAQCAKRDEMLDGFARLEHRIADARVDMIKFTFMFGTGQCALIVGLLVAFCRSR